VDFLLNVKPTVQRVSKEGINQGGKKLKETNMNLNVLNLESRWIVYIFLTSITTSFSPWKSSFTTSQLARDETKYDLI
jgi:hypothetical protein